MTKNTTKIDVRRVAPNATVNVWGTVSGAPHVTVGASAFRPDEVNLTFVYDFGRGRWRFQIYVNGQRIRRDGTPGRSGLTATFHEDNIDQAPEWVRDFVGKHTPPAMPRMKNVG